MAADLVTRARSAIAKHPITGPDGIRPAVNALRDADAEKEN